MSYPNLDAAKIIALDIETYDPDLKKLRAGPRRDGKILGTAIAVKGASWYFIDKKSYEEMGRLNQVVEGPNIIICDKSFYVWLKGYEDKIFIGANFLYDLDYLQYEDFNPNKVLDVQIAEPLIDENQGKYNLDFLGKKHLGHGKKKDEIQEYCDKQGLKGDPRKHLYKMSTDLVGKYAKIDAEVTLQVFEKQLSILKDQDLIDVFDMEMRLFPMLREMKKTGVRISRKKLYEVDDKYTEKISTSQKELDKLAGFPVNVNSGKDLKKAFDKFGYSYTLKEPTEKMKESGKTGNPCFDAKALETYKNPLAGLVGTVRNYKDIKSKYIDGLDKFIVNGRLHCDFNPMKADEYGTVSGRFSAKKPALQGIPSKDPEHKKNIRGVFLPEDGYLWGRGDESQIELRMLAHYGIGPGSEELRQRLINNPTTDIHQECADMVGIERKPAKTINFGVVYGMGIAKLCYSLGLSLEEGQEVLNNYHLKLPFLRNTTKKVSDIAARRGFIRTILKRRRRFPDKNWCYKAANSLFQGTAAEVMKKTMVDAWESGIFNVLVPHLTVHDELDYSKPQTKEGYEAVRELKYIAENCIKFKVPLVFDIEEGDNWGNLKSVDYT